jgi:hypothetical protein
MVNRNMISCGSPESVYFSLGPDNLVAPSLYFAPFNLSAAMTAS